MPYALKIPATLPDLDRPDLAEQRAMHAVFLEALAAAHPDRAETAHEARTNPFTQALRFPHRREEEPPPLWWRVTLLDDALYEPFRAGLEQTAPDHLGDRPLHLDLEKIQVSHRTYDELAAAPRSDRFQVDFHTPTSFKQRRYHNPIPEPYRCFQSWWGRWRHFAPPRLAINTAVLDVVSAHLVVSYYRLRSQLWRQGRRAFAGGVGEMSFRAFRRNKVQAHWWDDIAALAAFAPFCGTGLKTAQGMGQTAVRVE